MALFLASAACVLSGELWPWIWFVAVLASQSIDHLIGAPLRANPGAEPSPWLRRSYAASLIAVSAVYSSIAAYLWFCAGEPGRLFALLLPAGSMLNFSMQMARAPKRLVIGAAPHAAYMVGLPIASGVMSPEADLYDMILVSLGALLFLAHVALATRRNQQSADALHRARDEADDLRRRAETASAAKSDFLATISHEIRTPMNAVVAAAGLLERTPLSGQQVQHVRMLSHSADLLTSLLRDVLDLQKIESGKLVLESARFELVDKLDLTAQLWRARAAEKGIGLEFDPGDLPAAIVTDPLRLQQIVFNLLSNAVKFTDAGGVCLRGGLLPGERLWIEVSDTGCGMDAEAVVRVFEPFEQATAGTTRLYGGSGLGLSISRRLAELLGGKVEATSALGVGSTFRVEIPYGAIGIEPKAPPAFACDPWAGERTVDVLLAEDHAVNQQIIRMILEPLGVALTVAENGVEAVRLAAARPYDLILMDMQMPQMDGVEAARRIRVGPSLNARTPILALTANAMDEHRARWREVGVEVLLSKPIDIKVLIAAVGEAAGHAGGRRFEVPNAMVRTAHAV
jgi:signal transduction histidine kinase/CheY-like chemotaxis protein